MATYAELRQAEENDTLRTKIRSACLIAAEVVRNESTGTANHAARAAWARSVYENPDLVAERMTRAVLAQNAALTFAQITGATDSGVQTAVNNAIDALAGTGA